MIKLVGKLGGYLLTPCLDKSSKMDSRWDPQTWPPSFLEYLEENNISPEIYLLEPSRFVYLLKPSYFESNRIGLQDEIREAMVAQSRPNLYSLPGSMNIAHTRPYKEGAFLAIDPSSVLAVDNLLLQIKDNVLDLCCAPGAKLVLMSHFVENGSVTGVDISRERLGAAISMAKKYHLPNVRLFWSDGAKFNTPMHQIMPKDYDGPSRLYTDCSPFWSSSAYRKQKGRLDGLYDKVLVDVQCTHDGSIKHIRKHVQTDWKYYNADQFSRTGLADLYELQYNLLHNGFKLLKDGGLLVYSTCSLSKDQNEAIIERFIRSHSNEAIIETPSGPIEYLIHFCYGTALRIKPDSETGGGFFLCKIRKVLSDG